MVHAHDRSYLRGRELHLHELVDERVARLHDSLRPLPIENIEKPHAVLEAYRAQRGVEASLAQGRQELVHLLRR